MVQDRYGQLYQSSTSAYTQPNNAYSVQPASPEKPKFIGKLIFSIILSIIPPYLGVVPLILTIISYFQWKHGNFDSYKKTREANILCLVIAGVIVGLYLLAAFGILAVCLALKSTGY
jgi:hypothetical protein